MGGREDVIRGLGPAEWFGIGVDGGDVSLDGLLQLLRRAMDTAADLPRGEVGKESLGPDCPRTRLWASGDRASAAVWREGRGSQRSCVYGVVVHHEMNLEIAWHGATWRNKLRNSLARCRA